MSVQDEKQMPSEFRVEDKSMMNDSKTSLEKGHDSEVTWTPQEERSALRRLDWNLIPLLVHQTPH